MSNQYLGSIFLFAGNFAPRNSAFCDGSLLPINQYTALYSLLGTTYGGNGSNNFALPDLRGRVPAGMGQLTGGNNYALGMQTGTETVTLTTAQLPAHSHVAMASSNPANQPSPSGTYWSAGPAPATRGAAMANVFSDTPNVTMAANAIQATGNSQAHSNLQPLLVINYCIVINGIYPSRP